jgi:hypothetical protein
MTPENPGYHILFTHMSSLKTEAVDWELILKCIICLKSTGRAFAARLLAALPTTSSR